MPWHRQNEIGSITDASDAYLLVVQRIIPGSKKAVSWTSVAEFGGGTIPSSFTPVHFGDFNNDFNSDFNV